MTAMFPDSGVPWTDARNSLPNPSTANCNPLWYSTSRCKPRFDPAAANAVLSELLNLINKGEVVYDCAYLNNVERATRYLIQRGLTRAGVMNGGPNNYSMALDPTLTRYNNFLTLTVMPAVTNVNGGTYLDIDGHGLVPVLRNDALNLEAGDMLANIPYIVCYLNGAFFLCGLASSQVPIVKKGGLDAWIRSDGNDTTGDGTANTPDKAFKTIDGCWSAIGSRYAATPLFQINMRIGLPGEYRGGNIGAFGGNVSLTGDIENPSAYIIMPYEQNVGAWTCFRAGNMGGFSVQGLTFKQNVSPPNSNSMFRNLVSNVYFYNCIFDIAVSNPNSIIIENRAGTFTLVSSLAHPVCRFTVEGHGNEIGGLIWSTLGSMLEGATGLIPPLSAYYEFNNLVIKSDGMRCDGLSVERFGSATDILSTGCTGMKYRVFENSILTLSGKQLPGDVEGVVASGGQFIA